MKTQTINTFTTNKNLLLIKCILLGKTRIVEQQVKSVFEIL